MDIAVWNISIQNSSATQATLLTNLSPIWVGIFSFLFLGYRPRKSFWAGTLIALTGMILFVGPVTFLELKLDMAFFLGVLSGVLYAFYILVSKAALEKLDVITFMSYSMLTSTVFLFLVNIYFGEQFLGFSGNAWLSLLVQGIVCQLIAWLLISYATQNMRATRVSLSLLSQMIFAALLAAVFIGEKITTVQIFSGLIILAGIAVTFYEKKKHTEA
jgi:drug/metabolite transporter (DMT)-like permease